MKTRKGFSLIEVIVVIALIALLTIMAVPILIGFRASVRTTLCANNLKRIGEAARIWTVDGLANTNMGTKFWKQEFLIESGWTSVVMKFASDQCLLCPDANGLPEGKPVEQQIQIKKGNWYFPLVIGPQVIKFSDTQWRELVDEGKRVYSAEFIPDDNPNVYWWGFDGAPMGVGDDDFQDIAFKITNNGDGTATVFVISETAGTPEIAWMNGALHPQGAWQLHNVHKNRSLKGVTFTLKIGASSNYAMNEANLDGRDKGKLMALDYLSTTARSTDNWDVPEWDRDEDGRPDFLRHRGRLNVLFTAGDVRLQWRDQVDPIRREVELEYWQP